MPRKVALVTGASSGIGMCVAAMLKKSGYVVYGTSRRAFGADEREGVVMLQADVNDEQSVRRAVETVLSREGRLDAVVSNAGIGIAGPVESTSVEEAISQFDTNLFGFHRVVRACLPALAESHGRIVAISSVAARVPIPYQGFYSASKAALEALAAALSIEARPFGVKVTVIEPGDTRTGFTDSRRFSRGGQGYERYAARAERSVAVMERDERGGMPPESVARVVLNSLRRANPPFVKVVGFKYKAVCILRRILPEKLVLRIIALIYG